MKRNNKFKLPVKLIFFIVIIFLALFFIIGYSWKVMSTADCFKVTDVIARMPVVLDFSYLKNRNIFTIDLRKESESLLIACPDFSKVRLVKVLPNRIFVDFIKRSPIALVKLYKYFFVDDNQTLFYSLSGPQDLDLPVIIGLETKIFGAKNGTKYNIKELTLALNIIKEARNNKILRDYKIKKIDVSKFSNTLFFITSPSNPEYLEVRIGDEDIKNKIVLLSGVVAESGKNQLNIKYIDLRFKEPVVKYIDVK